MDNLLEKRKGKFEKEWRRKESKAGKERNRKE